MTTNKIKGLGINVVLRYFLPENMDYIIEILNELRFEWIRLEFDFYDWLKGRYDKDFHRKFIDKCIANKIKILGLVTGAVPGNIKNMFFPSFPYIMDNIDKFLIFLDYCVSEFPYITHWEIWNEEDTKRFWIKKPNITQYRSLLEKSFNLIKKIRRNSKILCGGVVGDGTKKLMYAHEPSFFKKSLLLGLGRYFDIGSFHLYSLSSFISIEDKKKYIRRYFNMVENIKKITHDKKIWLTEAGISRKFVKISQNEIAEIYYLLYQYCRPKKINLFLWTLIDPSGDYGPFNPETDFGFLNKDLEKNEIYAKFCSLF